MRMSSGGTDEPSVTADRGRQARLQEQSFHERVVSPDADVLAPQESPVIVRDCRPKRSAGEDSRELAFRGRPHSLNCTGRAGALARNKPSSTATRIAADLLWMPRARMNVLSVCSKAGVMWMFS
jgi:hypothetical protein